VKKDKFFNRLFWMMPDGKFFTYDKRHLFRLSGEEKIFTAGNKKLIVELKGWKICPMVCYDLRFPVWSRRTAQEDYDVLIYAANWPEKRIAAWNQLLPARAIENQCYVIGVNRWGKDGTGAEHPGFSAAFDFTGKKINEKESGEFIETVTLSYGALQQFRSHFPFHMDADAFRLET
jgi:predicted amidohydrolase